MRKYPVQNFGLKQPYHHLPLQQIIAVYYRYMTNQLGRALNALPPHTGHLRYSIRPIDPDLIHDSLFSRKIKIGLLVLFFVGTDTGPQRVKQIYVAL